ncbi:MAG: DUF4400 domain-containing protein [Tatlockia sp.]|nr:DUF4400 domain-containing protein [Tatlockia sp.]
MAMKTQYSKKPKQTLLSLMVLIFLSWLILLGWTLSLWFLSGFNSALKTVSRLSQQQMTAVSEVNIHLSVETKWLEKISTDSLNKASVLFKTQFNKVLPEDSSELNDFFIISKRIWLLINLTTQILLIKLLILLAALPLFALAITAGLIDGLNQRAIRTASLGRESSYAFHKLNRYFSQGLLLMLGIWLAIPLCITPAFVFVPVSILLAVMVSITASRFKKYL